MTRDRCLGWFLLGVSPIARFGRRGRIAPSPITVHHRNLPRTFRVLHLAILRAAITTNATPTLRPWVTAVLFGLLSLATGASFAQGASSTVERLDDGVYLVRDDAGNWGGASKGMTHQRGPDYQAKKALDLSTVAEDVWTATSQVRLSAFFCVRDYSMHDAPSANGLDEAFEIVINGKPMRVPTSSGVPVYEEKKPMDAAFQWHSWIVPKERLLRGPNELVFRMASPPNKKPDDYLYLGIDNSVAGGKSWVKLGKADAWRQDRLNVPGGQGEYMVRLYLMCGPRELQATWQPEQDRTDDPQGVVQYAGTRDGIARIEWDGRRLDRLSPVTLSLKTGQSKPLGVNWLNQRGETVQPPLQVQGPDGEIRLDAPLAFVPDGLVLQRGVPLKSLTLKASRSPLPVSNPVDMAPLMQLAKGHRQERKPTCAVTDGKVTLANDNLRCQFAVIDGRLKLTSLWNEWAAAEMSRQPDDCDLLLVEVDGKRYAGTREFRCRSLAAMPDRPGFTATLFSEPIGLEAVLSVWVDEALRMGLTATNRSNRPIDFKLAFPHLSGLAISQQPAEDYYFFPWGGGIISDQPAVIRRGYGDHEAIYQVMDLFSPKQGAGLGVWCTDADGRHKVLALRKHVAGRQEANGDQAQTPTSAEYLWTNSLEAVPGVGMTYEYLRRTRKPGESFAAKDVALQAHPGDWHAAVQGYADWCHRVWAFRPYPSRLGPVINMLDAGWGQSPIFGDGHYRTDFVRPRCDCLELMSWWEWSPLGPWRTPWDQVEKRLGPTVYQNWAPYIVKDPVTGQLMQSNSPGDYDGYNERWGGLPALREAIRKYREMGALVTLYTDPLRVDDNTKCGQRWGKSFCIHKPDDTPQTNYEAWNPCLDVEEYRRWVAETMGRVMRETGADGIRLDEYGHHGSACFSKLHPHTFAEWGTTEWQRCIAESTRLVRQAMDAVRPGLVLTTEHPGYDYLMPWIEGCITYDLTVQATPLRPLECNLQRFYFPECKCYELDHRRADPKHRKRFWNAVGSFGAYYPAAMHAILRENDDAFSSRRGQPLVPTLARRVYANRFEGGEKTIYTLYNATGHTFCGPVLRLNLQPDEHLIDLLSGKTPDSMADGEGTIVSIYLERDDVACLARLPARLQVQRSGDPLEVTVRQPSPGWQVVVCDGQGDRLLAQPVGSGSLHLNLAQLATGGKKPVGLKLLDGSRLIDMTTLGPASP
jgi:hypothetical protein